MLGSPGLRLAIGPYIVSFCLVQFVRSGGGGGKAAPEGGAAPVGNVKVGDQRISGETERGCSK